MDDNTFHTSRTYYLRTKKLQMHYRGTQYVWFNWCHCKGTHAWCLHKHLLFLSTHICHLTDVNSPRIWVVMLTSMLIKTQRILKNTKNHNKSLLLKPLHTNIHEYIWRVRVRPVLGQIQVIDQRSVLANDLTLTGDVYMYSLQVSRWHWTFVLISIWFFQKS